MKLQCDRCESTYDINDNEVPEVKCPKCQNIIQVIPPKFENPKVTPINEIASDNKICPYCAEEIKGSAIKCRFCGEWLNQNNIKISSKQEPIETLDSPEFISDDNSIDSKEGAEFLLCPFCNEKLWSDVMRCIHCGELVTSTNQIVDTDSTALPPPLPSPAKANVVNKNKSVKKDPLFISFIIIISLYSFEFLQTIFLYYPPEADVLMLMPLGATATLIAIPFLIALISVAFKKKFSSVLLWCLLFISGPLYLLSLIGRYDEIFSLVRSL